MGMHALGMKTRPVTIPDLQMAASVGQTRLMSIYNDLFGDNKDKAKIGQILLTHDALENRIRHVTARNTLLNLISHGIIPVINENDTISTREIEFGDNDVLAALTAILVDADALVLLSTTDGLREPDLKESTKRVSCIAEVNEDVLALVKDKPNSISTGGMASKLHSAQLAASNGIPVIIANGRKSGVLKSIFDGCDEGTLLMPKPDVFSKRKRWIAFFNRPEGNITIDDGAAVALHKNNSFLPVGIITVDGNFNKGSMVNIRKQDGMHFARGLVEFSSNEILALKGKKTMTRAGEIIHRRNIVVP